MSRRLVLASASPARLRLLRNAGFAPDVLVSGVDEDDLDTDDPAEIALVLAERKAAVVAAKLAGDGDAVVVGCDSVLDLDGAPEGKPPSPADAVARWRRMRGREGILRTGHCVVDVATGASVSAVESTIVRFGRPTDAEIDRYVSTGEPLAVAGAFTLDGLSGPFIDGVDGDPGNVIGLSLPLLRSLLHRLDIGIVDLWC
jgi:septum formation protein